MDHAEVPDAKDVYLLALRYSEASRILEEQAKRQCWAASAPRLLVDSFAIELYLKCLYILDTGLRPLREHDWVKLFEALRPQTQEIVREQFGRIVEDDPVLRNLHLINPAAMKVANFSISLNAARRTFDQRRYLFETPTDNEWFYADLVHKAVQVVTSLDIRLAGICHERDSSEIDVR